MNFFVGEYERNIDAKNRIQLPSQLRAEIDPESEGRTLLLTLGETPGTLALFTKTRYAELAERAAADRQRGPASRQFEIDFFGRGTQAIDMDKQGRIVLPEKFRSKARLGSEIMVVGQFIRIELWDRAAWIKSGGFGWDGDDWPTSWPSHLRQ